MEKAQFSQPLAFLQKVGLNPLIKHKNSVGKMSISLFLILFVFISSVLEVTLHFNGIETCSRASESMIVQYQLLLKIRILLCSKDELSQLINDTSFFWSLDRFGSKLSKQFARTHQVMGNFFRVYKTMMVLMTIQYITSKVIFKSDKPLAISYGEGTGLTRTQDNLNYLQQSLATIAVLHLIVGFDGLFYYFVGRVLVELRMVKVAFERFERDPEIFLEAIKHHIFVLRFIDNLNGLYSNLLLNQHVSCLFGICFGLFLMSKDGTPPDLKHIGRYLPYIVAFMIQTFTFCFIGSLITDWSLEIPDAMFYSGWGKTKSYRHKNDKLIAMIRGQKAAKLTLGQFGELDLNSFTLVVKNAFSFYTFVNAINQQ